MKKVARLILTDAWDYFFLQSPRLRELRLAHGPPWVAFLNKRHRFLDIVVTDSGINGYSLHVIRVRRPRSRWKASVTRSTILDTTQQHLHGGSSTQARVTNPEDIDTVSHTYSCISAGFIRCLDIPAETHLRT